MTDYQTTLQQLHTNLNTLREREAKYSGNAPLELLNQISDHEQAIALTEQTIKGELTEAEWQEATKPLLLALEGGQVVNIQVDTYVAGDQHIHQASEPSPGPPNTRFWRWLVTAGIVIALVAGLVAIVNDSLGIRSQLFPPPTNTPTPTAIDTPIPTHTPTITPTPLAFATATNEETLIVIATFHETTATKTEPHTKIRRTIEEAVNDAGLDTVVHVEEEQTVLKADEREAAEALGDRYNASMIIWGEDTGVQVFVNFLNLRQPDLEASYVKIEEEVRVQLINPDAYARYITDDLPAYTTFLSLYTVAQSHILRKEYLAAIEILSEAINSLPQEISQDDGIANAYFELGWLYHILDPKQYQEQVNSNYTKAIELNPKIAEAYRNRGISYMVQGQVDQGVTDLAKAFDLNPEFSQLLESFLPCRQNVPYIDTYGSSLAADLMELGQRKYFFICNFSPASAVITQSDGITQPVELLKKPHNPLLQMGEAKAVIEWEALPYHPVGDYTLTITENGDSSEVMIKRFNVLPSTHPYILTVPLSGPPGTNFVVYYVGFDPQRDYWFDLYYDPQLLEGDKMLRHQSKWIISIGANGWAQAPLSSAGSQRGTYLIIETNQGIMAPMWLY